MKHLPNVSCRLSLAILLACWLGIAAAPASAQQPPSIVSQSSSIAAGEEHTCAINPSGGVVCWGEDFRGVLGPSKPYNFHSPVAIPDMNSGVTSVVSGNTHSCALKNNGKVFCWGDNQYGQISDHIFISHYNIPTLMLIGNDIVAIAAGKLSTCALSTEGIVECWGTSFEDGTWAIHSPHAISIPGGARAIAMGGAQICAINRDNNVFCWGTRFINGVEYSSDTPTQVQGLSSPASALAVGEVHACALLDSGAVECWGTNDSGMLGDGTTTSTMTPVRVQNLGGPATAISAKQSHTCAIVAGAVKCWGFNDQGQIGNGTTENALIPSEVLGLDSEAIAISAGGKHTCAVLADMRIICWGNREQVGEGGNYTITTPTKLTWLDGPTAAITLGYQICALSSSGAVSCLAQNSQGQNTLTPIASLGTGNTAITAGTTHACAITKNGAAMCWGNNVYGQLGNDTTTSSTEPVQVKSFTSGVTALVAGGETTCAIKSKVLWCWGNNVMGQVGYRSQTRQIKYTTPKLVQDLSNATTPALGSAHTCSARNCWGANSYGQLGTGSTLTQSDLPIPISGLTSTPLALSAGMYHTCAIISGGAVKCWGDNTAGQLGNGTTTSSNVPTDVATLTSGVTALASGAFHTCALKSDSSVYCWGNNSKGALGAPTTTVTSTIPLAVANLGSGVKAIAAGNDITCAIKNTGDVFCWGDNQAQIIAPYHPGIPMFSGAFGSMPIIPTVTLPTPTPTAEASATPTPTTEVAPTIEASATPTPTTEVAPTIEASITPSAEATATVEVLPTIEASITPSAEVLPTGVAAPEAKHIYLPVTIR